MCVSVSERARDNFVGVCVSLFLPPPFYPSASLSLSLSLCCCFFFCLYVSLSPLLTHSTHTVTITRAHAHTQTHTYKKTYRHTEIERERETLSIDLNIGYRQRAAVVCELARICHTKQGKESHTLFARLCGPSSWRFFVFALQPVNKPILFVRTTIRSLSLLCAVPV